MDKNDVRIGNVFKDNDVRVAYPFFTVEKIAGGRALGSRRKAMDGPASSKIVKVRIDLDRLIKGGTRGYTLVQGAVQPVVETPTEPEGDTAEQGRAEAAADAVR